MALLMIGEGATDWNACQGGYKDLAELMIEKGATDWDWGLRVRRIGIVHVGEATRSW